MARYIIRAAFSIPRLQHFAGHTHPSFKSQNTAVEQIDGDEKRNFLGLSSNILTRYTYFQTDNRFHSLYVPIAF